MRLDMKEGVLGDVCETHIGVLFDFTSVVGFQLSGQKLDGGGFTSSVGTNNRDTRALGDRQVDVKDGGSVTSGVLK